MLIYLLIGFLIGLGAGWYMWARAQGNSGDLQSQIHGAERERERMRSELDQARNDLKTCTTKRTELTARLEELEARSAEKSVKAAKAHAEGESESESDNVILLPSPTAKALTTAPASVTATPAAKPAAAKPAAAKPAAAKPRAAKSTASDKTPVNKTTVKTVAKAKPAGKTAKPTAKSSATGAPAVPAALATPAKGGKDDLRRLLGIGPVNERKLHEHGITTFAQIAAWKAADVRQVEEYLQFDGRIKREKWVEQAKLLAAGKEAEFARRFPTAADDSNT